MNFEYRYDINLHRRSAFSIRFLVLNVLIDN